MRHIAKSTFVACAATLAAFPAMAHTGAGHAVEFAAGLEHPAMGADHLLAMLSVGVWSALAAPKGAWLAPLAFVTAMLAGAGLSLAGVGLPNVEGMIAASVLALGLMVVAAGRLSPGAGIALCGLFALFHGHAHASEAGGNLIAYIAGFALSTAAIHGAGIGVGMMIARNAMARLAVGGAVTAAGAFLLAGL